MSDGSDSDLDSSSDSSDSRRSSRHRVRSLNSRHPPVRTGAEFLRALHRYVGGSTSFLDEPADPNALKRDIDVFEQTVMRRFSRYVLSDYLIRALNVAFGIALVLIVCYVAFSSSGALGLVRKHPIFSIVAFVLSFLLLLLLKSWSHRSDAYLRQINRTLRSLRLKFSPEKHRLVRLIRSRKEGPTVPRRLFLNASAQGSDRVGVSDESEPSEDEDSS